jgi:hypothetical protein
LVVGTVISLPDLASTAERIAGYLWELDEEAPYCQRVIWRQVSADRLPGLCSGKGKAAEGLAACAMNCLVLSKYSEEEAKRIDSYGESLYDHEARHVLKRRRHPV